MKEKMTPETFLYWDLIRQGYKSQRLQLEDADIHYLANDLKYGDSYPLIVLLHGIGSNIPTWYRVMSFLRKEGHSVLSFDLPGHGWSSDYAGELSPVTLHEVVVRVLDRLANGRKIILVGNSLGGSLALRYGFDHPERLEGLMVISPAGGFATQEDWDRFKKGMEIRNFSDSLTFAKRLYHQPPWFIPLVASLAMKSMNRIGVKQIFENTKLEHFDMTLEPGRFTVPTLFIWGKSEKLFDRKNLEAFKRALPENVVFEEPEGVGHCPQMDRPDWTSQRMKKFIGSLRQELH